MPSRAMLAVVVAAALVPAVASALTITIRGQVASYSETDTVLLSEEGNPQYDITTNGGPVDVPYSITFDVEQGVVVSSTFTSAFFNSALVSPDVGWLGGLGCDGGQWSPGSLSCSFEEFGSGGGEESSLDLEIHGFGTFEDDVFFNPGEDRSGFALTVDLEPNPNSVPEPATWAMMLVGFGLIGGAMRRRVAMA